MFVSVCVAQRNPHFVGSIVVFDGRWIGIFLHKLARVLRSQIWKIWRTNVYYFVFGYYSELTFVRRQIICKLFCKYNWFNHYIFHVINQCSMLMALKVLSIFKFISNISRYWSTIETEINMDFTLSRREYVRKVLSRSNNCIFTTINLHINIMKSDNLNTSNSDNVIGKSNLPCTNVHTKISFNILITLKK